MEAGVVSFEWKPSRLEGRALFGTHGAPETETHASLISPVSPKHVRTNYSLLSALTVLMVVAVGAIFCCCYHWEGRLRGQSRARTAGGSELIEGTRSSSSSVQDTVPSISVIMPGDDIPRFVAWAATQGVPVASTTPDGLLQPESNQDVEKAGQSIVVAPNSWRPGRVSG